MYILSLLLKCIKLFLYLIINILLLINYILLLNYILILYIIIIKLNKL